VIRKSLLTLLAAAALLSTGHAFAQDHLVTPDTMRARLQEAQGRRQQDLATVDAVLARPEAAAAAAVAGAPIDRVRAALPALSDAELADLAVRAAALQSDPVAGLDSDIRLLLMIFLIVAIVILVLQAVD